MLAQALIFRREQLKLKAQDVVERTGIPAEEYALLENPATRKMSKENFRKLDEVLFLGEIFGRKYVTPYESLADALKTRRLRLNLTQAEVARRSNMSVQNVWNLEHDKNKKISYVRFKKMQPVLRMYDEENFEPFFTKSSIRKVKFVNDGLFGQLVLEKRLALRLSQESVASHINVHDSIISKIESGSRTTITPKTALKLMDELEFSEEEKKKYLVKQ